MDVYNIALWAAIAFTVIGGMMGLAGIWIERFFSDTRWKLLLSDVVLAVTSLIVASIARFMGP